LGRSTREDHALEPPGEADAELELVRQATAVDRGQTHRRAIPQG
jgi:hypothetical protein